MWSSFDAFSITTYKMTLAVRNFRTTKSRLAVKEAGIAQLLSELLAIVSTSRSSQGILMKPDFAVEACITTIRLLKLFYCGFKLILESPGPPAGLSSCTRV